MGVFYLGACRPVSALVDLTAMSDPQQPAGRGWPARPRILLSMRANRVSSRWSGSFLDGGLTKTEEVSTVALKAMGPVSFVRNVLLAAAGLSDQSVIEVLPEIPVLLQVY